MPLMGFDGWMVILEGQIASRKYGRQGGNGNVHSGHLIFPLHGDPKKSMDSCNRGNVVHVASESQVLHGVGHWHSKGKPASD